jgi:hypothetical protein
MCTLPAQASASRVPEERLKGLMEIGAEAGRILAKGRGVNGDVIGKAGKGLLEFGNAEDMNSMWKPYSPMPKKLKMYYFL